MKRVEFMERVSFVKIIRGSLCATMLLLCSVCTSIGRTPVPAKVSSRPSKQVGTIFWLSERIGVRSFQRATVDTSHTPWRLLAKTNLLEIQQEDGIAECFPASRFDQFAVTIRPHGDAPYSGLNDLEWVSGSGNRKKRLTYDDGGYDAVVWSPDGKRIASLSQGGIAHHIDVSTKDKWVVYFQEITTGRRKKLFEERPHFYKTEVPHYVKWITPQKLVYSSQSPRGLFLLDTQKHGSLRLTPDAPDYLFPEARLVFWLREDSRRLQFAFLPQNLDALARPGFWKTLKRSPPLMDSRRTILVSISPDHQRALLMLEGQNLGDGTSPLAVLDLKTRSVQPMGSTGASLSQPRWAKDGTSLLFALLPPSDSHQMQPRSWRIVRVAVPEGSRVSREQVDWNHLPPLKVTELMTLPEEVTEVFLPPGSADF